LGSLEVYRFQVENVAKVGMELVTQVVNVTVSLVFFLPQSTFTLHEIAEYSRQALLGLDIPNSFSLL